MKNILTTLALGTALLGPAHALDPLRSAPANADFVLHLNVPALISSPVTNRVIDEMDRDQIESMAKFVENATDVNVFEDIHEFWVFARIEKEDEALVFVKGEFNEEKILDMVRINSTYAELEIDGFQVHHWEDDSTKYATFVDDFIVLGGSEGAIKSFIQTSKKPERSIGASSTFTTMNSGLRDTDGWAILLNRPETRGDFGNLARAISLDYALVNITAGENTSDATLRLKPADKADLPSYRDMTTGLMGAARLLQKDHDLAVLVSEKVTTTTDEENGSVVLEMNLTNDEVFDLIALLEAM